MWKVPPYSMGHLPQPGLGGWRHKEQRVGEKKHGVLEQLQEAQQNRKLSERSPWQGIRWESQRARQKNDKLLMSLNHEDFNMRRKSWDSTGC